MAVIRPFRALRPPAERAEAGNARPCFTVTCCATEYKHELSSVCATNQTAKLTVTHGSKPPVYRYSRKHCRNM